MSESFPSVISRLDLKKYVLQFEEELRKILTDVGTGKTPEEVESTQTKLQALIRKQAQALSREMGLAGNHVVVFLAASTVLTTAWLSFSLSKEAQDPSKPFEDRLTLTEMLNSLENVLPGVIAKGKEYADYSKK